MRVPPPGSLKLDRAALLRDVRQRFEERLPQYADAEVDPTDPGWLVLEQAAWMAEILSEQLDRYPFAVVQQFVRMMGGHVRPAQPALGVVVVDPGDAGELTQGEQLPSPWRFFTTPSETSDAIEFVPVERSVPVVPGRVAGLSRVDGGELFNASSADEREGVEALVCWPAGARRSRVFDGEEIDYELVTDNVDALLETLGAAIEELEGRHLGWLALSSRRASSEKVVLTARIEPSLAFARTAPGGLWHGGDLEGDWGVLDESPWTPSVTVRDHPMLPPHLRGARPLPGSEDGRILLPSVPENTSTMGLLQRQAAPVPATVVTQIWKTLTHIDTKLAAYTLVVRRRYRLDDADDAERDWVPASLQGGVWSRIQGPVAASVIHVALTRPMKKAGSVRVGLVLPVDAGDEVPELEAYGLLQDGTLPTAPLSVAVPWHVPVPLMGDTGGMRQVVALDIEGVDGMAGVVLAARSPVAGAMLNPLLVANTPAVRDGREVQVRRNVPEAVSLLHRDAVTPAVIAGFDDEPVPGDARSMLADLPLAFFQRPKARGRGWGKGIADWAGLSIDPSDGLLTLNAPAADGRQATFRAGDRLKLTWYRRTDGARGNVEPGAIQLLEEEPGAAPTLNGVHNPLGTFLGTDRESDEAAVERLFAPAQGLPVMPADFEQWVRQMLGSRGREWFVRCWSYTERTLISTALWPPEDPKAKPEFETYRTSRQLEEAGSDCVLVTLGPDDEAISQRDLDWARQLVERRVRRLAERMPVVRRAVVTRFWPLTLRVSEEPRGLRLPCFDLRQLDGVLVDERGRACERPTAMMYLNAAVTRVEVAEEPE